MKETQIDRLDRERKRKGWNWAEFARAVKESPQTIQNWRARGRVPGEKHFEVAGVFGKSVEWLKTGLDREPSGIDRERLIDVLEAVDDQILRKKYKVPTADLAKLIIDLYEGNPGGGELSSATVIRIVRPVLERLEGGHGRVAEKASPKAFDRGRTKKR